MKKLIILLIVIVSVCGSGVLINESRYMVDVTGDKIKKDKMYDPEQHYSCLINSKRNTTFFDI